MVKISRKNFIKKSDKKSWTKKLNYGKIRANKKLVGWQLW